MKTPHKNRHKPTLLDGCTDWPVITDIDWQLTFLTEITATCQHPDLIIWSINSKKVITAELTITFRFNIDWTYQCYLEMYEDLREQCIKNGWSTDVFPLEIVKVLFKLNLYIVNQTQTFTGREEGLYKKDPKQDSNCI